MRMAVVDIGTNSTRLLIADIEDGQMRDQLERRTNVTRLGAGVDVEGRLGEEAMRRVYTTLDDYAALIEQHQTERAVAVLTSAVRDAANGRQFARTVEERYHLEPHVLAGEDEARLTFLGAVSDHDPEDSTPTLVVDIGGGSTELVIGRAREIVFHVSTQAGVVRQTERHLHTDPPTEAEQEALAEDVSRILADGVPDGHRRAAERVIAVAGTATSLAAIDQELEPYDPEKVHGYVLSRAEFEQILQRLAALPLEELRQVTGLDPARAPTIVAGVLILREVLRLFGLEQVEVSENDILLGAALEFARGGSGQA
jgi:exopolyphosphatase/guanosine-5'-triphosphate,3'-diphosphate pyrophosphatase